MKVIHDQGLEFLGRPFEQMLTNAGICPHATGVRNPRANAIVERLHQTIGNSLRTHLRLRPPTNLETAQQYIDNCLATAAYALRALVHRILQCSPGTLAFHRDMFLDVPVLINLETIRQQREALRDTVLQRENKKRFLHDYIVGELILKLAENPPRMAKRATGPFPIEQATTTQQLNIRKIRPFRQ
jgi:transposase InsO family protein